MICSSATSPYATSSTSSPITSEHTPELEETDSYLQATGLRPSMDAGINSGRRSLPGMMGRVNSPSRVEAITKVLNDNFRFSKEKERYADIKNTTSLCSVHWHKRWSTGFWK